MFVATPASIPELRQITQFPQVREEVCFVPSGSLASLSQNESGSWVAALQFLLGDWAMEEMPAHYRL